MKLHAVLSISLAESLFTTSSQETSGNGRCNRDLLAVARKKLEIYI